MTDKKTIRRITFQLWRALRKNGLHPLWSLLQGKITKMVAYPTTLPLDAITRAIATLRTRKIVEEKQQFLFDFWNIQGYFQGVLVGSPSLPGAKGKQAKEILPEGAEAQVQELLVSCQDCVAFGHTPQYGTFLASKPEETQGDALTVITLVLPMLIKAIEAWLANRKK